MNNRPNFKTYSKKWIIFLFIIMVGLLQVSVLTLYGQCPQPTAGPGNRCGAGTVTLSAMTYIPNLYHRWYSAPTGGYPIQEVQGNPSITVSYYTTPYLSTTTTYYVSTYNPSTSCESSRTAVTATINNLATPYVAITSNPAINGGDVNGPTLSMCEGTPVTFTANTSYSGSLQWYSNGSPIGGQTGTTYSSSSLVNDQRISVTISGITGCVTSSSASSQNLRMVVTPKVTPTVSISPQNPNICSGDNITFNASASNAGTPSYAWKVDGVTQPGQTGSSFSSTTFANGQNVTVEITANNSCQTTSYASASSGAITVNPLLPVSVSISGSSTLCNGVGGGFFASITNGGGNPSIEWRVNNIPVSNNQSGVSNIYSPSGAFNNGDQVTCRVTSNATCPTNNPATSNVITITKVDKVTPTVNIVTSPTITGGDAGGPYLSICQGTGVTFSASGQTNAGSNPTYQWYSNGSPIPGQTTSSYPASGLVNDQRISVVMTSNASCLATTTATSQQVRMILNSPAGISSHPGNSNICVGNTASFSVTATGANVSYQWQQSIDGGSSWNNINLANSAGYSTSTSLSMNNYRYRCYVSNSCGSAYSNTAVLTFKARPSSNVTGSTSTCAGTGASVAISLTGSAPWNLTYYDGSASNNVANIATSPYILSVPGTSTKTYTVTALSDNAGCPAVASDMTGSATVTVNPLPSAPVTTSPQPFCGSASVAGLVATPPSGSNVEWYSVPSGGTALAVSTALNSGTYYVQSKDAYSSCTSTRTAVTITINPRPAMPDTFTVSANTCGDKTLTRGTPPTNVTWYWQGTTADGTNMGNSNSNYMVSSSGTYYIRAFTTAGGCWSSSSKSKNVTVNLYPGVPGNPTTTSNLCGNQTLTRTGTPPANVTWYWQGPAASGTSTVLGSGVNYTATSTGTYHIRAYSNAGCWSNGTGTVAATVNSGPSSPSYSNLSKSYNCTSAVISTSETRPGVTFHWQTTSNGTSKANGVSFTASSNGTYYLRACDGSGCWDVGATSYVVDKIGVNPSAPGIISPASIFGAGNVTFTVSGPNAGYTYTWHDTGQNPLGTGTSKATTLSENSSIYYLVKAKNNENQCSSGFTTTSTVNAYRLPVITSSTDKIVTGIGATLSVNKAIGSTPYSSYQWKLNGSNINGANSENYLARVPGNYLVAVTASGAAGSSSSPAKVMASAVQSQPNLNYIISRTLQDTVTNESKVLDRPITGIKEVIQYFDGLGRPMQSVTTAGSPLGRDIVQPFVYDAFGREVRKYLPYTDGNTGTYKADAFVKQSSFYKNTAMVAIDDSAFSQTMFEASPMNRIISQGAPGKDWQPSSGHASMQKYEINKSNEVKLWTIVNDTICQLAGYYSLGQLYVTQTKDENGNRVREYKDKEGQIIMKKSYDEVDSVQTYYVYDDFGQLRYVLSPSASKGINITSLNPSNSWVKQLCYYYQYDNRKRMIIKQIPGMEPVYLVYDGRDRLVLSQDGRLRKTNKWQFTKYDCFNRAVMSGIKQYSIRMSQRVAQDSVNSFYTTHLNNWFETSNTTSIGYSLNNSYPSTVSESDLLTITYYDKYASSAISFSNALGISTYNNKVKGMATGGKVKRLDNNTWLVNTIFYDDKYRVIQTVKQNHLSGIDRITNKYDFSGKILMNYTEHTGTTAINTTRSFEYDHGGRLLKIWHTVGTGAPVLLSYMQYNEVGQLIDKKIHSTDTQHVKFLQSIDYRYNIRGWLTNINNSDLGSSPTTDTSDEKPDVFGMELRYNSPF